MNTDKHGSIEGEREPNSLQLRRLVIAIAGACLVFAVGFVVYRFLSPEPTWNGRRLSSWLNDLRPYAQQSGTNPDQAEAAVLAVGAQGVPLLLTWMKSEDSSTKKTIFQMLPRNLQRRWQPQWAFDRWWSAARAFTVLGTNAAPAVSELSRLLGTGKRGPAAAAALAGIGAPALPVLSNSLIQLTTANDAAYGLTRFGDAALPTFIYALTNSSPVVHQAALGGIRFCVYDQYVWQDPDLSRSSLKFSTTSIGAAMAAHAGRGKSLLVQSLDQCLGSTNQEAATAARLVKTQLGL